MEKLFMLLLIVFAVFSALTIYYRAKASATAPCDRFGNWTISEMPSRCINYYVKDYVPK